MSGESYTKDAGKGRRIVRLLWRIVTLGAPLVIEYFRGRNTTNAK